MLRELVEVFETDCVIRREYRGGLYQSRFDLYLNQRENPAGYRALLHIQRLMDGRRSCLDIAAELGIDFPFVKKFADALVAQGLAESSPRASLQ